MWETLPKGDIGLRTPPGGGPIAGEQSYTVMGDGSLYCVYRTIDGHPAFTYSRDGGRTWDVPRYKAFADGRLMKHPRAANFAWRASNGKYLYWFHNHGGRFIREHPDRPSMGYHDRNPVWLCGGAERDTPGGRVIDWSQPEIVLYHDDPQTRMSYPDLVEEGGKYFLTETEKAVARVHEIEAGLLNDLWGQFENRSRATRGVILELPPTWHGGAGGGRYARAARIPRARRTPFAADARRLHRGHLVSARCDSRRSEAANDEGSRSTRFQSRLDRTEDGRDHDWRRALGEPLGLRPRLDYGGKVAPLVRDRRRRAEHHLLCGRRQTF